MIQKRPKQAVSARPKASPTTTIGFAPSLGSGIIFSTDNDRSTLPNSQAQKKSRHEARQEPVIVKLPKQGRKATVEMSPEKLAKIVEDSRIETRTTKKGTLVQLLPPKHGVDYADDGSGSPPATQYIKVHWKDVKYLGSGGFGSVNLQQCFPRSQLVNHTDKGAMPWRLSRAVKRLPKPKGQEALDVKQFGSELAAITIFSQTQYECRFVKSMGWWEDSAYIYIAMEHCFHGDLQSHLLSGAKLSEEDGQSLGRQILLALRYMHQAGFAHRDVKPANILIKAMPPSESWWIKLGDFGISRTFQQRSRVTNTVCGTPEFMAPELLMLSAPEPGQAALSPLEKAQRSDIWAAGETLFQLLTRTSTFGGNMRRLIEYVDGHRGFPKAELLHNKISSGGIKFIEYLMAPNPVLRPTVMAAFTHHWLVRPDSLDGFAITREKRFCAAGQTPPGLAISPDGELALIWTRAKVTMFNIITGRILITSLDMTMDHDFEIKSAAFTSSRAFVVLTRDPDVTGFPWMFGFTICPGFNHRDTDYSVYFSGVWPRWQEPLFQKPAHTTGGLFLAISPNSTIFAMASSCLVLLGSLPRLHKEGGTPLLTDPLEEVTLPSNFTVKKLCFSATGDAIIAAGPDGILICDVAVGEEPIHVLRRERIPCPPGTIDVAISPVRKTFAALATDDHGTFVNIWDAKMPSWSQLYRIAEDNHTGVRSLSFSPDGKYLAILLGDGRLIVCHVERGDRRGLIFHETGEALVGEVIFPTSGDSNVLAVTSVFKGGRVSILRIGQSAE